jgi:hypothetical protein
MPRQVVKLVVKVIVKLLVKRVDLSLSLISEHDMRERERAYEREKERAYAS